MTFFFQIINQPPILPLSICIRLSSAILWSNGLWLDSLGYSSGLMSAPKTTQFKIIPASIRLAPFQSYISSNFVARGAKANVPTPDPHTAIPVAKDLRSEKGEVHLKAKLCFRTCFT